MISWRMILAAAALSTVFACANAGQPGGGYACPAIAEASPQLIYPIPNATGVPDDAGALVLAGQIPATVSMLLVPTSGGAIGLGSGPLLPAPSPLPSPHAVASASAGSLVAIAYPHLAPGTTYTVTYQSGGGPCPLAPGPSGAFTTQ